MIDKESSAKGGRALTAAKLAALAAARAKRKQSTDPIIAPEGWRSVDHLMQDTREFCLRTQATKVLARNLGITDRPLRSWLSGKRIPRQATVNAIAVWRKGQSIGSDFTPEVAITIKVQGSRYDCYLGSAGGMPIDQWAIKVLDAASGFNLTFTP